MTGRVFNIQRFSIHDGPGIRTTVFLKGCSLACVWCHNPESIAEAPELAFFPAKCIRCGHCFAACETGARRLEGGEARYDRARCRVCGRCAEVCYAEAIVVEGRELTADEVVAEVLRDKPFYDNSGGGVTLSGGEPLLQADFCAEVLSRCRARGVHTALDTAACVPWAAFERVLPDTRLVLLDLKLADSDRHRRATGAGNELILANARRLGTTGVPLRVRVPIVPGWTDDEGNLAAIADIARELPNLEGVELLPYHRFAESKYQRLGRAYALEGTQAPEEARLSRLAAVVSERGVRVVMAGREGAGGGGH
ncbi:MAG TPA: glycyl-radical enzyme activating protein [Planctomycetota bacterium]|nr:glycyl-radical enzyme activating protein [Planctomycetota bacterium]HRT95902.1 glycyl-radical enzyme activating protein [Planctomycetota bacterium]